jgi:hypothetical protein
MNPTFLQILVPCILAGAVAAIFRLIHLFARLRLGKSSLEQAQSEFSKTAILQCVLGGTVYLWLVLFAMPAGWAPEIQGHGVVGIPFAGFLAGGFAGVILSLVGTLLLGRQGKSPQ